jgi:hypothetical protein
MQRFFSICPKTNARVEYKLTIESQEMIMVEDIQTAVATFEVGDYHEAIADELHSKFGGTQTLDAHHHGTDVRTLRP